MSSAALHQPPVEEASRPKCLIVDDDRFDRLHLKRMISSGGADMDVVECETLGEARQTLRNGDFDIIFLDNNLPDGLGVNLAKELKQDARYATVPTLLVTGDNLEVVEGTGVTGVSKDFVTAELLADEIVSEFARKKGAEQAEDPLVEERTVYDKFIQSVDSLTNPLKRIERLASRAAEATRNGETEESLRHLAQIGEITHSLQEYATHLASLGAPDQRRAE